MVDRRVRRTDALQDKTIENGASVPHGLQVNELTLREHQERLAYLNLRLLSYEEVCELYEPEETLMYFGIT